MYSTMSSGSSPSQGAPIVSCSNVLSHLMLGSQALLLSRNLPLARLLHTHIRAIMFSFFVSFFAFPALSPLISFLSRPKVLFLSRLLYLFYNLVSMQVRHVPSRTFTLFAPGGVLAHLHGC